MHISAQGYYAKQEDCPLGGGLVAKSCPIATPWTIAYQEAPLSVGFSGK